MAPERVEGPPVDIAGPVEAEVFIVYEDGGRIRLTGPCGPAPWRIESRDRHPIELVRTMAAGALGPPRLVHSTSWRWEHDAIVLSFLIVVEPEDARGLQSREVVRADLARSTATRAPAAIGSSQVIEHALRHLAWLAKEDQVVATTLSPAWHACLSVYVPEPFRQLDVEEA
jgi:hypothetical protein